MTLIDSHAHLAEERYDGDRGEVLRRARETGVEAVVVIGYNAPSSARAVEIAEAGPERPTSDSPALFATVGFAPHNVEEADPDGLRAVRGLIDRARVVAVGEIGLDYHYDMPRPDQRRLFAEQLEWARGADLPVVVHSREAEQDVVAMIRDAGAEEIGAEDGGDESPVAADSLERIAAPTGESGPGVAGRGERIDKPAGPGVAGSGEGIDKPAGPRLRGVIHCFTEGPWMAEAAVALGFYVSFSGIVTFPSAQELRDTARLVPLERTLIETDSPYLAPQPFRGKRNEPAYVAAVAAAVAEIHGVSPEDVAEHTAANARRLYRLPEADLPG